MPERSFVIPVLTLNGAPHNIEMLLNDLEQIDGEVICIFNSEAVFERLRRHSRIDKFCFNKYNAGVSRSWNLGINLAEGQTVFILNEDLHVRPTAVNQMEQYLYALPNAVMVAPQGSYIDFTHLRIIRYFQKGGFESPVRTHDVSGFFFAIHLERFKAHKLAFDVRYSPCFMEEWDMGLQVMQAGLACYAVPVVDFDHHWGISAGQENIPISYFGKTVYRNHLLKQNREKFLQKWFGTTPQEAFKAVESRRPTGTSQTKSLPVRPSAPDIRPQPDCSVNTAFFPATRNRNEKTVLYLGLVRGDHFGWGVCSRYLKQELSKVVDVYDLHSLAPASGDQLLDGAVVHALTSADFFPVFPDIRGKQNYAYTFFEKELNHHAKDNARKYQKVLAGSSWCRDRMREQGIENGDVLIQGIDPALFFPIESEPQADRFVIFSGGKFELRKGQDLVLRAFKILQQKYSDVWLVNCWRNMWPGSLRMMTGSRYIDFQYDEKVSWKELMARTYHRNGLKADRIVTLDLIPHDQQRQLFARTDIAVFPNRCEGGTNLVLMEYMACGKPAIASNTSGHKDILTPQNAFCLNDLKDIAIVDDKGQRIASWQEPSLDEIVARLENAYHHRDTIAAVGNQAGQDMKNFTWQHSADRLLSLLNESR